jgi:hypothetical protein
MHAIDTVGVNTVAVDIYILLELLLLASGGCVVRAIVTVYIVAFGNDTNDTAAVGLDTIDIDDDLFR